MGMETMMIPGMLEMVYKIIVASQNVPVQKDKCRVLAEQISRLGPLLESFQSYPGPFSPQAKDAFKALWHALNRAYRVGVCKMLIELGQANEQLCRLKAVLIINLLVQCDSFQADFIRKGGVQFLCSMVQEDNTLACRGHALLALEKLVVNDVVRASIVKDLMLEKVVDLLQSECLMPFREAAAGVICILVPNSHVADANYLSGTIELLVELLRQGHATCKKKVVEALSHLTNTGETAKMCIIEAEGLNILFSLESKKEFLELVTRILISFSQGSDACQIALIQSGGLCILMEALEKVKMREKVATSLLNLVKFQSAQQSLIESGFINVAIRCLNSNSTPMQLQTSSCSDDGNVWRRSVSQEETLGSWWLGI